MESKKGICFNSLNQFLSVLYARGIYGCSNKKKKFRFVCFFVHFLYICKNPCMRQGITEVLLKLSSISEFSQNSKNQEMIAMAPHRLSYTYLCLVALMATGMSCCIYKWVWAVVFIRVQGNARSLLVGYNNSPHTYY